MNELACIIKVTDVYPGGFNIPFGFKLVGFRPPLKGETYITRTSRYKSAQDYTICVDSEIATLAPRIIIVPIPRRFAWLEVELPEGKNPDKLVVYVAGSLKELVVNKYSVIEK